MKSIDYTIGDDIVCINDKKHSTNAKPPEVKEGTVYKCIGLRICPCGCNGYEVNIGLITNHTHIKCTNIYRETSKFTWKRASRFKKLDTLVDISELTDILQEPVTFKV